MRWRYTKEDILFITYELAILFLILSLVTIFPIIIALKYGESSAYYPFLIASIFSAFIGLILRVIPYIYFRFYSDFISMERKHAIGMVVLSWPLISIPSALPLYLLKPAGQNISYLDAFFEAISGWTTTGLTTFGGEADVFLHSVNFWRHFMQYLGGLGIVVMGMLILLPIRSWNDSMKLISASGRDYRIVPNLSNTVKIITIIYLVLMLLGTLLFFISGMPLFDSLCHSMSGFSTGGYSVRSDSLMAYNSAAVTIAAIPIMIIGQTNFVLIYYLIKRRFMNYLEDIESRTFWYFLIVFMVSFYALYAHKEGSLLFNFTGRNYFGFIDVIFNTASALTTTGWNTIPYTAWSGVLAPIVFLIIIVSMVIGANTSSTGGGLKALRVGVMFKSIYWQLEKIVLPKSAITSKRYQHQGEKIIKDSEIIKIYVFVFIYFLVLFISFIIFLLYGYGFFESFFEVTSAIGTVGLSSGVTSVGLEPTLKIVLCINMWLGRIEVLPIFYFIRYLLGRKI